MLGARKIAAGLQYTFIAAFSPNFHGKPRKLPVLSLRCDMLCDSMLRFSVHWFRRQSFIICLYGTNMPFLRRNVASGEIKVWNHHHFAVLDPRLGDNPFGSSQDRFGNRILQFFPVKKGYKWHLGGPFTLLSTQTLLFKTLGHLLHPSSQCFKRKNGKPGSEQH